VKSVAEVLVELGKLSPEDLRRARRAQQNPAEPLDDVLEQLGLISSSTKALAVSIVHGLPLAKPADFPATLPALSGLSPKFMRDAKALPIALREDGVLLAMADPGAAYVIDAVRLASGRPVIPCVAAGSDIEAALNRYFPGGGSGRENASDTLDRGGEGAEDDVQRLQDLAREAPVVRLVNQIIADAVGARASDIHIEPFRDELRLRYRVDGALRHITPPPAQLARAVASRIKILARLNIAERRLPQDGRARFAVAGRQIDLRVATMPTIHGESVSIRLLEDMGAAPSFASLGLSAGVEESLRRALAAPHGMVLATGPTGSGKTTLLYAALNMLNREECHILTVEDPIEYQISGINQVQVKAEIGLTFARLLRSMVRHDPDIIMVGEMRDGETANIGVHAALTGHLVLTTLHTNSAAGAIARLIDMEVPAFLLTSTLHAMIGQRLVRVLCRTCREPVGLPPELAELAARHGIAGAATGTLFRPVGCEACYGTGYYGRTGIFELIEMDDGLRELVRAGAGTRDIERTTRERGIVTMFGDGLQKCLAGITTLAEVARVTEAW
jgi:general secretion pathway protein E